eukprot:GEMP01035199.1.p1 GENE.GEMP01035199.1~~GEMP01035199.1.p1  ORF type:complete len:125 (+),score=28.98 GEMP01035199.1:50-424(+)
MGKKAKKGGKKADDTPEPAKYDHPEIRASRIDKREVTATIKLAAPVCSLLEFQIKVTPSTKISFVVDRIIDRHGGSIRELSVCVNRFHPEEIVSPENTLEDCGVISGDCIIYYDFVPTAGALLA